MPTIFIQGRTLAVQGTLKCTKLGIDLPLVMFRVRARNPRKSWELESPKPKRNAAPST